jgi:glycerophosphoryl diester phosphodiesterase
LSAVKGHDNPWLRSAHPLVIAHRGQCVDAPENTMAAFRLAADLGADMIETDVNVTRDGVLVLTHDVSVDRTTSGEGLVRDLTVAEVRRLDAGSWFGEEFVGERVPTLTETIGFARQRGLALCLEAKGETLDEATEIAIAVARLVAAEDLLERVFVAAFEHDALAAAARAVPGLLIAPERLPEEEACLPDVAVEQARALGAPVLQTHYALLTDELVDALHAAGVALWSWPTTSAESVAASIRARADGLMGDDVRSMVDGLAGQRV